MFDSEDFSFNGRHCREFGAAFRVDKWPVAAAVSVNKVKVSGRHGTLRYKGKFYLETELAGTLYFLDAQDDLITYNETLSRAAEISAWLHIGGRGRLVMDALPDRFRLAEIESQLDVDTEDWANGQLPLRFVLQPFSYALRQSEVALTLAASQAQNATVIVPGSCDTPLGFTVSAQAALSWVQIQTSGKLLRLENMSLPAGGTASVEYDLEHGEVMVVRIQGAPGMRYLAASSTVPFEAKSGSNTITAQASAACKLTIQCRGRWH